MQKNNVQSKIDELDKLIDWFEGDQFCIDNAMVNYKKAITLAKEIKSEINNIKNKVTLIKKNFDES